MAILTETPISYLPVLFFYDSKEDVKGNQGNYYPSRPPPLSHVHSKHLKSREPQAIDSIHLMQTNTSNIHIIVNNLYTSNK